jgi:PAS domain S-box-containing protein
MGSPAELLAELTQLRARVAQLETELADEQPLRVGDALSPAVWQALVAASPMFVSLLDRDCRFLYLNQVNSHYTHREILGSCVLDWMPPELRAGFREAVESVFRDQKPLYFEGVDTRGGARWGNHLGPVLANGNVIAVSNISEDITVRVNNETQLKDKEARLRFLVESMPIVCWTIDFDLRFKSSRGAGLGGLGLEPDQVVGMTLEEYFGGTALGEISLEHHRQALHGETVVFDGTFAGRNYQTMVAPLRDETNNIIGAIGVAVDITERCRYEEELKKTRDELEQRVRERTVALDEANKSLKQERVVLQRLVDLNDRDRQLTAYEIHDGIVQDMTAALMFFEVGGVGLEQQKTHTANSYQQGLQILRSTIREARRVMNGISPDVLEQFGPIEAIAAMVQEKQELSGIQMEFTHHVQFERLAPAIELAMFRIAQESLNNIWKHSGSQRAELVIKQRADRIQMTIRDWGHGFDLSKIAPKRYGLLGIRERSRLLGGEAKIESIINVGTTISVELPLTDFLMQAESSVELS